MSDDRMNPQDGQGKPRNPPAQKPSNPFASATQESASSAPLAPWEIAQNSYEPPVAPEGTRYAAYQDAPHISPSQAAYPGAVGPRPSEFELSDSPSSRINFKLIAGAIVAVLMIAFLITEFVPWKVAAPAGFTTYKSPDSRFSCDAPSGWSQTSFAAVNDGDDAVGGTLFKSGAAKIDITTDTVSDLKAAVLLNSGAALPEEFTQDPATVLHKMDKSRTETTMKNYVEQPAQQMATNIGPAFVSEFTGKGGFLGLGGAMHGYRASISDGAHTIEVVMQCPENSWSNLSPAFQRVIKSFAPAQGGVFSPLGSGGGPAGMVPGMQSPSATSPTTAPKAGQSSLPTVGYGGGDPPTDSSDPSTDTNSGSDDSQ